MKKNICIYLGIFLSLAVSRLIPHPPNFTSLIALSFYVPVIFGLKFTPFLILSYAITDFIIGFHSTTHWTWGSVFVIGLIAQYFDRNLKFRIVGSTLSAVIFFTITNFGVWTTGMYGYKFESLVLCYLVAIPFFANTLISTILFSFFIEAICKIFKPRLIKI